MEPIDIRDLALDLSSRISRLADNIISGPLLVTRDGEPEAVIIRHQAYAPRLHDFGVGQGAIFCHHCDPSEHIRCDTTSLGIAMRAANEHWRDTHRPATT